MNVTTTAQSKGKPTVLENPAAEIIYQEIIDKQNELRELLGEKEFLIFVLQKSQQLMTDLANTAMGDNDAP